MLLYTDLHIHSPYSMATSRSMTPGALLDAAARKGLGVLGSGDALHPVWRRCWMEREEDPGDIVVVPTAEVEDSSRIHHLIVMEEFEEFADLGEALRDYSKNVLTAGRPHVALTGEAIAAKVHDLDGLIGPAHAFTPWTSLYAHAGSVRECYGDEKIDFLELGLSADSSYGAGISDLAAVPFLSNSDAHSTAPHRLGREFTGLAVKSRTRRCVLDALGQGRIAMNAGFFPEEGKYNRTACIACYRQYTREEAEEVGWRCPTDGKRIKKGVADRAAELTDGVPQERPPYLHIIPLGEIVMQVLGACSPTTRKCTALYDSLLETFGDEITILVSAPVPEIREVNPGIGNAIDAFRAGRVILHPGGGGRYGSFSLP
jgi:uncharacterized protein (TIGR00375 family)